MSYITSCLPLRAVGHFALWRAATPFPTSLLDNVYLNVYLSSSRDVCALMMCQECRCDLLCRETQTPEMGKILAAVMVGRDPGRALEDLDSSACYFPQP